jgi:hypothetical protein
MAYRRKRKGSSGFLGKCSTKLNRIRKAKKATSKVKSVNSYQKCLDKQGVRTGMKKKRGRKS